MPTDAERMLAIADIYCDGMKDTLDRLKMINGISVDLSPASPSGILPLPAWYSNLNYGTRNVHTAYPSTFSNTSPNTSSNNSSNNSSNTSTNISAKISVKASTNASIDVSINASNNEDLNADYQSDNASVQDDALDEELGDADHQSDNASVQDAALDEESGDAGYQSDNASEMAVPLERESDDGNHEPHSESLGNTTRDTNHGPCMERIRCLEEDLAERRERCESLAHLIMMMPSTIDFNNMQDMRDDAREDQETAEAQVEWLLEKREADLEKIEELRGWLRDSTRTIHNSLADNERLQVQVDQLTKQLQETELAAKAQADQLIATHEDDLDKIAELQEQLKSSTHTVSNSAADNEQLQVQVDQMTKQLKDSTHTISDTLADNEKLQVQVDQMAEQLQEKHIAAKAQADCLIAKHEDNLKRIAEQQDHIKNLTRTISDSLAGNEPLQIRVHQVTKKLEEAIRKHLQLKLVHSETIKSHEESIKARQMAFEAVREIEEEIKIIKAELDSLKAQLREAKKVGKAAMAHKESAQRQIEAITEERDNAIRERVEMAQRTDKIQTVCQEAMNENSTLKKQLEEFRKKHAALAKEKSEFLARQKKNGGNASQSTDFKGTKPPFPEANRKYADALKEIDFLEHELDASVANYEHRRIVEEQKRADQDAIASLRAENKKLQESLQNAENIGSGWAVQSQQCWNSYTLSVAQKNALEADVAIIKPALEKLKSENGLTAEQLEHANAEIMRLAARNKELEGEVTDARKEALEISHDKIFVPQSRPEHELQVGGDKPTTTPTSETRSVSPSKEVFRNVEDRLGKCADNETCVTCLYHLRKNLRISRSGEEHTRERLDVANHRTLELVSELDDLKKKVACAVDIDPNELPQWLEAKEVDFNNDLPAQTRCSHQRTNSVASDPTHNEHSVGFQEVIDDRRAASAVSPVRQDQTAASSEKAAEDEAGEWTPSSPSSPGHQSEASSEANQSESEGEEDSDDESVVIILDSKAAEEMAAMKIKKKLPAEGELAMDRGMRGGVRRAGSRHIVVNLPRPTEEHFDGAKKSPARLDQEGPVEGPEVFRTAEPFSFETAEGPPKVVLPKERPGKAEEKKEKEEKEEGAGRYLRRCLGGAGLFRKA
ncbi:hypothetical protein BU24DRAFT_451224 [Aaosphaeria arxii CBS 175.79]|uniref:Uncharacterized protein n=1 Tax=Aaosphaeria arxii CBS 175.79 TaxID=1450172 RepID=A0A6A5XWY3_9PLEO|nr:uncharacterized protein BU24DRAFT_451224 [Aaosphaeria arxii CBS 175.79]KAF2016764.1 hypothetical protein BU24DRAFT_451224 [Aaosphaeria arxii CBS 175.79]